MTRPRLLDLFCGAGGATKGYQRAGFYVVGVDIEPQPNYCGDRFIQADAIDFLQRMLAGGTMEWVGPGVIDAYHASPPCQHYANVTRWRGTPGDHPDLIGPTRELLDATGVPWVMENVRTREIRGDFVLCGSMFDLPIRRHRHFETNWADLHLHPPCQHRATDLSFDHGGKQPESLYRSAMGCHWMTVRESRDAIPPAYSQWIGEQLLAHLAAGAVS